MASEANTASAIFLVSRWWCSSDDGMGGPMKIRLRVEYISNRHATQPRRYRSAVGTATVLPGRDGP